MKYFSFPNGRERSVFKFKVKCLEFPNKERIVGSVYFQTLFTEHSILNFHAKDNEFRVTYFEFTYFEL